MSPADQHLEVDGRLIKVTNLDKVLYPETGTTKGDVIAYYQVVAPYFVPHAAHRPATRKRWPNGVGTPEQPQTPFFHKNLDPKSTPDWVRTFTIEHSEGDNVYPLIDDAATLVWLAQLAALETHTSPLPEGSTSACGSTPATRKGAEALGRTVRVWDGVWLTLGWSHGTRPGP